MLKRIMLTSLKRMVFSPKERAIIATAEYAAKGVKKIREAKKEAKKKRELQEKIDGYANRGIVITLIWYLFGFVVSFYLMRWGWIGRILVVLGYLGQYQNLKEVQDYVSVTREKIFTVISFIGLVGVFFLNFY